MTNLSKNVCIYLVTTKSWTKTYEIDACNFSVHRLHRQFLFPFFSMDCLIELKFCEVSRNSFLNRCWKFQLWILKNKKVLFLKKRWAKSRVLNIKTSSFCLLTQFSATVLMFIWWLLYDWNREELKAFCFVSVLVSKKKQKQKQNNGQSGWYDYVSVLFRSGFSRVLLCMCAQRVFGFVLVSVLLPKQKHINKVIFNKIG